MSGNMKIKTKRTFSQVSNLEYQDISNREIGNLVISREARQNRLTEAFREARSNYDNMYEKFRQMSNKRVK